MKGSAVEMPGLMESVENQKQVSHSFHEPLGNLANRRRDSHISTAAAMAVEKWKTKKRFPTFPPPVLFNK